MFDGCDGCDLACLDTLPCLRRWTSDRACRSGVRSGRCAGPSPPLTVHASARRRCRRRCACPCAAAAPRPPPAAAACAPHPSRITILTGVESPEFWRARAAWTRRVCRVQAAPGQRCSRAARCALAARPAVASCAASRASRASAQTRLMAALPPVRAAVRGCAHAPFYCKR
jgi:hypothetical protein